MTFDFPTWIAVGAIGYSATLPLARLIMLESVPTLQNLLILSMGMLSLFFTATAEGLFKYFSLFVAVCITALTYKIEIIGPIPPMVNMRGKTVIVTGANSGIGFETARQLAEMGATVIMGCRSLERSKPMMDSINTGLKNVPGAGKALLLSASLDLNNLSSVRKWTQNLIESGHTSIDVLVCNAGLFIQHVRSHKESYTRNGKKCEIELEDTFVSNHLGHHLLMHLLLPYLHTAYKDRANKIDQNSGQVNKNGELEWKNTDPSRIILVSSSLHKLSSLEQGRSQFLQWPNTTKDNYDQWRVYGATKLAEMLSAQHFERLLKTSTDPIIQQYKNSIYITTLHPGNPVTGVTANLPYILQLLERIFYPFMYLYRQTWQLGAFNSVWCASAPETLTYGMNQYFIHMQPAEQSAAVFDEQAAKQVYEFSEMVCHE